MHRIFFKMRSYASSSMRQFGFSPLFFCLLSAGLTSPGYAQMQPVAMTPSSLQSTALQAGPDFLDGQHAPRMGAANMDVTLGKSTLLKLPAPITRISVGSPNVADVMLISPREVYILGKLVGMTNITLWTKDGKSTVIDVTVLMDATALRNQLAAIMPDEKDIKVMAAGDSLILSGFVSNTLRADRAVALADAFIRTSVLNMMVSLQQDGQQNQGGGGGGQGGQQGMQVLRQGMQSDEDSPGAGAGLGSFKVINLLQVRDNQQVMLEVKVAELNRTEAEKLGFDFAGATRKTGSAWTQIMAGLAGGGAANFLIGKNLTAEVESSLPRITNFQATEGTAFLVDAEKRDEVIKVLAEPNIVAISGQEASFLVGGEILIPVFSGAGGNVRLQSKQFGVGLNFTPTVLEEGRINLRVNPEVSELVSFQSVASTGLGGIVAVPTFKTRRIATTVQLRDGQSLAIGGLLQDNFKEQLRRFPILGEVPVLGALFSSNNFQMDKTELVIIVTPRLVQPLQPDYALPTDAFIRPGRGELLIQGRMEGKPSYDNTVSTTDSPLPDAAYQSGNVETGGFQMR
ncbi:MAG: type II and III secretion system protein family protein [Nitrosomonas sp.]|nr:type II and III secretion system protein family protein [Nitrosomonas sp.]